VQATKLDPTEQDALVKQIGLAVLRFAPPNWDQVTIYYRAVGRYFEADGEVVFDDDEATEWQVPADVMAMFGRLRAGMYRDARGTWYNARYRLDHPSNYNLDYDRKEPDWRVPPPPPAYADDLRMFPRTEDNIPEWLRRRAAGMPPETGPRFRMARIFDGSGSNGRPIVNRPPLGDDERAKLLNYLNTAPPVVQHRNLEVDRLDPEGRPLVPVAFHTDGTWIWPAAVNYYLNTYKVSPEPDLVEHIRRMGARVPEVDERTRAAAAAFVGRGIPPVSPVTPAIPVPHPPQGPPRPPVGPPPQRRPPTSADATMAVPRPPSELPPPRTAAGPPPAAPPPVALPSQGPPGPIIDALRARLNGLGVPATAYRIGPPGERAWTMDQTPDGWRVGWFDRDFVAPAMFEDVADAAAFLFGKIMMDTSWRTAPEAIAPVPPPAPQPPPTLLVPVPAPPVTPPPALPSAPLARTPYAPPDDLEELLDEPVPAPVDEATVEAEPVEAPEPEPEPEPVPEPEAEAEPEPRPAAEPQPTLAVPIGALLDPPAEPTPPPAPPPPAPEPPPEKEFSLFEPRVAPLPEPPLSEQDQTQIAAWVGGAHRLSPSAPAVEPALPRRAPEPVSVPGPPPRTSESVSVPGPPPRTPEPVSVSGPPRAPESLRESPRPPAPAPAELAEPEPRSARGSQPTQRWPIQPLSGEPPLTLFRGKRLMDLAPGTEIDRFGEPDGNLTFAAGTPFTQRSLVPEWIDRPFHTYRVAHSLQVLSGTSIPWFEQAGGGTAYLLPGPIKDLVADGRLVEVHRHRPPER
jgi:hypothetical protein